VSDPDRPAPGPAAPRDRVAVDGPPDRRDLDGDFGHRHTIPTRFADTDAMGHVNNAVYLTYAEAARLAWWGDVIRESILREEDRAEGLILAEIEVAFRSPVLFGETVTVETRATRIGRTSLGLEHRMTAATIDGPVRVVGIVGSVIVSYDYRTERPRAWRPEVIDRIEAFEGRRLRD
jgi:acyl-CoA thioester hydrolase